ncbi:MAG: hypothetical protein OHK93_004960 [Ramalina farinacea]|uniref:Uncharacterized protein n=1 Tax=Ramalina farinacea TaxID=258253 RepID=A0AA43U240_9LECA|nr:hypothetical protein [Ramalina farinacea]
MSHNCLCHNDLLAYFAVVVAQRRSPAFAEPILDIHTPHLHQPPCHSPPQPSSPSSSSSSPSPPQTRTHPASPTTTTTPPASPPPPFTTTTTSSSDTTSYSTTQYTTPSTHSTTLPGTAANPYVSGIVDVHIVTGWNYPCDGSCTWESQIPTSTTGTSHTWWETRQSVGGQWVSVATPPPTMKGAVLVGGSVSTGVPYVGKEGDAEAAVECDGQGRCREG